MLDQKQSEQFVDSVFGGAAIVVDSRWAIEEAEAKELSKCIYGVLELFPVKLEDNPLILQRAFAIFGLVMALFTIFMADSRISETLAGNNDGIIGRGKKKEIRSNAGAGENQNSAPHLS